jgi:hypothetical protein
MPGEQQHCFVGSVLTFMVCCFGECHCTELLSSLNTIQGHSKNVIALNAELNPNCKSQLTEFLCKGI